MAVPKVAVIALVAIIAVPILLGYAMNIQEVNETEYKPAGESVNVTPLLQNDIEYTNINANIYQTNSSFRTSYQKTNTSPITPFYNTINTVSSSLPYRQFYSDNWAGGTISISSDYIVYDLLACYTDADGSLTGEFYDNGNLVLTVNDLKSYHYEKDTKTLYYRAVNTSSTFVFTNGLTSVDHTLTGFATVPVIYGYIDSTDNHYIDISKGYYFNHYDSYMNPTIQLPDKTSSFIMTINLDSITDANYTKLIQIYPDAGTVLVKLQLTKSTINGEVSWQLATGNSLSNIVDLYYDPSINDNTYQLYVEMSKESVSALSERATVNYSLKYVGGWPSIIGVANPYLSYDFQISATAPKANNFYNGVANISFINSTGRTPTVRIDSALISGYEMQVISDNTYNPSSFKTNPATTISDITKYGRSIEFGGNTYTVTNGNITLGTHQIPVKGLTLDSIPNGSGGYDNRINGTVISSTADPSQIGFNGKWSASISTTAQSATTYTKTEWIAGSFAWDGMDKNFLIAGLMTSLGAFIALGIYSRRSGRSVLPLMLVCGGAALLFFIMI